MMHRQPTAPLGSEARPAAVKGSVRASLLFARLGRHWLVRHDGTRPIRRFSQPDNNRATSPWPAEVRKLTLASLRSDRLRTC